MAAKRLALDDTGLDEAPSAPKKLRRHRPLGTSGKPPLIMACAGSYGDLW